MDRTPGGLLIPKGVNFAHLGDEDTGDVDWLVGIDVTDPADIQPDEGDEQVERPPNMEVQRVTTGAVSGLGAKDRAKARELVLRGIYPLLQHPSQVHYTQGDLRWRAISQEIRAWDSHGHPSGKYLHNGDCSSTDTWLLWGPLKWHFGIEEDVVNGTDWTWGWTGTMRRHGKVVQHRENWKVGDQIFYEGPDHVITYTGGGFGFSHGSDDGPYKVDVDYRHIVETRRYI
jgi:hypothetical protein